MNRKIPFEEFWRKYPLHKARKDAERAWDRLGAKDRRAAIDAIDVYRESCEKTGVALKYAHGWLNGRRWEDEADEVTDDGGVAAASADAGDAPAEMDLW